VIGAIVPEVVSSFFIKSRLAVEALLSLIGSKESELLDSDISDKGLFSRWLQKQ
jgi:hypothetical protein